MATTTYSEPEPIQAARSMVGVHRRNGLSALNEIFRSGSTPTPSLEGPYCGELIALAIAPLITQLMDRITAAWMPWKGKRFDPDASCGENIFHRDSYRLAHFFWPGYRGYVDDGPETYRAFAFRTYLAPGLTDPDRQVLKIDYDLPENPRLSIRRVLDELVQVSDDFYLGKAHLRWWWGRWQTVAYFSLIEVQHDNQPDAFV